jgi:hypothetical protein
MKPNLGKERAMRRKIYLFIAGSEIPQDRIPLFTEDLNPGGKVPLLNKPEDIHIIVAGGIPGYTFGMYYFAEGPYKPQSLLTKLIRGATLTKAGH